MNELLTIAMNASGIATLACPEGKQLRVVGITANLASMALGDELVIEYRWNGQLVVTVKTGGMTDTITQFSGFLNQAVTPPLPKNQNPVSGDITYAPEPTQTGAPLPDVWFDTELTLTMLMTGGSTSNGVVLYERKPKPLSRA